MTHFLSFLSVFPYFVGHYGQLLSIGGSLYEEGKSISGTTDS